MFSKTCPNNRLPSPTLDGLRLHVICIAVVGLFGCWDQVNAQCNCGSQATAIAQPVHAGTVWGQAYRAPSVAYGYRGYESRSGVAQFTYYKTPVGSARGIPGQTVPVQTVVANFAPPSNLSGTRSSTPKRTVFRQPLIRRW